MAETFMLSREQWFPKPVDQIFPFFSSAGNLEKITPGWLRFEVMRAPEVLTAGARIDYKLRIHGIPIRWQSEITAWEPPFRFVDEQRRGPYSFWVHEHRFEPSGEGTLVRDVVRYGVPGGRLVQRLLVGPDLERIFAYRQSQLSVILGGAI